VWAGSGLPCKRNATVKTKAARDLFGIISPRRQDYTPNVRTYHGDTWTLGFNGLLLRDLRDLRGELHPLPYCLTTGIMDASCTSINKATRRSSWKNSAAFLPGKTASNFGIHCVRKLMNDSSFAAALLMKLLACASVMVS